jgi:hypothetical protein
MADTSKQLAEKDANQTLRSAYNKVDASLTTNTFLVGMVGRKVEIAIADEVETYTFSENGSTLYVLTLTYTDATRETLVSAERTA